MRWLWLKTRLHFEKTVYFGHWYINPPSRYAVHFLSMRSQYLKICHKTPALKTKLSNASNPHHSRENLNRIKESIDTLGIEPASAEIQPHSAAPAQLWKRIELRTENEERKPQQVMQSTRRRFRCRWGGAVNILLFNHSHRNRVWKQRDGYYFTQISRIVHTRAAQVLVAYL